MAASHEMVKPDVEAIEHCVRLFRSSKVIEVTNKRIIIKCPDHQVALNLATQIRHRGYAYDLKKGRHTNAMYIQAWL